MSTIFRGTDRRQLGCLLTETPAAIGLKKCARQYHSSLAGWESLMPLSRPWACLVSRQTLYGRVRRCANKDASGMVGCLAQRSDHPRLPKSWGMWNDELLQRAFAECPCRPIWSLSVSIWIAFEQSIWEWSLSNSYDADDTLLFEWTFGRRQASGQVAGKRWGNYHWTTMLITTTYIVQIWFIWKAELRVSQILKTSSWKWCSWTK